MKAPLDICIGFDPNETVAFFVLAHSILRHASRPVRIMPLMLPSLIFDGSYARARDPGQSTDFTFSRFLTPYYADSPISIFMDCDMLCRADIWELVDQAERHPYQDILVVKHDYTPRLHRKFLGQKQTRYPFKNWSSLIVFNRGRTAVKRLTPEYVNHASPMALHQFGWIRDRDGDIGDLGLAWNHLVGEYAPNPAAKLVHFTLGGPWFEETADCEFSQEWVQEKQGLLDSHRLSIDPSSR